MQNVLEVLCGVVARHCVIMRRIILRGSGVPQIRSLDGGAKAKRDENWPAQAESANRSLQWHYPISKVWNPDKQVGFGHRKSRAREAYRKSAPGPSSSTITQRTDNHHLRDDPQLCGDSPRHNSSVQPTLKNAEPSLCVGSPKITALICSP